MMQRFFGNSRERLLLSLLGDDEITPAELQRLKDAIARAADDGVSAGGRTMSTGATDAWGLRFARALLRVRLCPASGRVLCWLLLLGCVCGWCRRRPRRYGLWFGCAVFLVVAVLPMLRALPRGRWGDGCTRGMLHAVHVDVRWSFVIAAVWVLLRGFGRLGWCRVRCG